MGTIRLRDHGTDPASPPTPTPGPALAPGPWPRPRPWPPAPAPGPGSDSGTGGGAGSRSGGLPPQTADVQAGSPAASPGRAPAINTPDRPELATRIDRDPDAYLPHDHRRPSSPSVTANPTNTPRISLSSRYSTLMVGNRGASCRSGPTCGSAV